MKSRQGWAAWLTNPPSSSQVEVTASNATTVEGAHEEQKKEDSKVNPL